MDKSPYLVYCTVEGSVNFCCSHFIRLQQKSFFTKNSKNTPQWWVHCFCLLVVCCLLFFTIPIENGKLVDSKCWLLRFYCCLYWLIVVYVNIQRCCCFDCRWHFLFHFLFSQCFFSLFTQIDWCLGYVGGNINVGGDFLLEVGCWVTFFGCGRWIWLAVATLVLLLLLLLLWIIVFGSVALFYYFILMEIFGVKVGCWVTFWLQTIDWVADNGFACGLADAMLMMLLFLLLSWMMSLLYFPLLSLWPFYFDGDWLLGVAMHFLTMTTTTFTIF